MQTGSPGHDVSVLCFIVTTNTSLMYQRLEASGSMNSSKRLQRIWRLQSATMDIHISSMVTIISTGCSRDNIQHDGTEGVSPPLGISDMIKS